jgi:hypothetical protein
VDLDGVDLAVPLQLSDLIRALDSRSNGLEQIWEGDSPAGQFSGEVRH